MTAALPAAQPPKKPQTPKPKPKKIKPKPDNPASGTSGGKKPKTKGKKSKQSKQTKRPKTETQQQSQGNQSTGQSQQAQQPPNQQEIYYDYDQLHEAAREFAKTLAYEMGQNTRQQVDASVASYAKEVRKQASGNWILNSAFWVFITMVGASSTAIANLNILSMVPGVGMLTSMTSSSGAAGQVDVSQIDMTAAVVGMSANGFPITSGYGPRTAPTAGASSWHTGVDVGADVGTPLYAPAAGKVVCTGGGGYKYPDFTGNAAGYGPYGLEFQSADPNVPDFFAGHNSACTPGTVTPGQKIGAIGNEGVSTGPHLHLIQFDESGQHTQPAIGWVSIWMGAPVPIIKGSAGSTSGDLVSLVKEFESCSETAYWDYAQYSIGYGTKGNPGERVSCGPGGDAEQRLLAELDNARSQVQAVVKVPLNQHELDALTTFQYNTGAIQGSDLLRQLNAGNKQAAANEFDRWVHADGQRLGGLVDRRREEKELFLTGDYQRQQ